MAGISPRIFAEGLSAYISQVELPLRSLSVPAETAATILRRGAFAGSVLEHHLYLDRAMLQARSHILSREEKHHSVASGTTIIADALGSSKGRFSRSWHAPPGGLWGAMIYVSTLLPLSRLLLPLAVGVACCEAMRQHGASDAVIRWINDILLDGRKAAGFLLEGFFGPVSGEDYNLIGFGINVNNTLFPAELAGQATALSSHLGREIDLTSFTYCFLAKLRWNLGLLCHEEEYHLREQKWCGTSGRHSLLERWCELSDTPGRRVVFGFDVLQKPQFEALVTGISTEGGLMLRLDDGTKITEHSGEIRYL